MAEFWFVVRLAHIVAGIGWLGEVLTVNFVLLPALSTAQPGERARLLQSIFPNVSGSPRCLGALPS